MGNTFAACAPGGACTPNEHGARINRAENTINAVDAALKELEWGGKRQDEVQEILRKLRYWINGALEDVQAGLRHSPSQTSLTRTKRDLQNALIRVNDADPSHRSPAKKTSHSTVPRSNRDIGNHRAAKSAVPPRIGKKFVAQERGFESLGSAKYPTQVVQNPPGGGVGESYTVDAARFSHSPESLRNRPLPPTPVKEPRSPDQSRSHARLTSSGPPPPPAPPQSAISSRTKSEFVETERKSKHRNGMKELRANREPVRPVFTPEAQHKAPIAETNEADFGSSNKGRKGSDNAREERLESVSLSI